MGRIAFDHVTKKYGDVVAVNDVSLEAADGEFLVLVGPSGCGKTSALRCLAGLEEVTDGTLYISDRDVTSLPPKDRDVAMVFQNYALYPHMDVYGNLAFALRLRKQEMAAAAANAPVDEESNGSSGFLGRFFSKNAPLRGADAEIDRRVRHAAEILNLSDLLKRRPRQLSGGQRQRVALGRAIVREPQAFLMDEPLSNLDTQLRMQTRAEILKLHQRLKVTTIYVTHDQQEAMTMGDRLAVMKEGQIQQLDTPQRIYDHPASLFVATFIGSPAMNVLPVTVQRSGDQLMLANGDFALPVPGRVKMRLSEAIGKEMTLGIRPEHVMPLPMSGNGAEAQDRMAVNVDIVEPLGAEVLMYMSGTGGRQIV
ncbi:MAG: ATP-binding cassette domain-containing protein, partial [Chloroflexota bacterium]|nr:ATP-binding cassette domain-containing protein [Chloroflexota bacterium]